MASRGIVLPAEGLNVRTGPGTEHQILGVLDQDDEVGLIDLIGEWWGAETRFGPGFIHGAFIKVITSGDAGGGQLSEQTYTCLQGDTLFSIGRRFGVAFREIAVLNGLVEPFTLQVGQVLRLPGGATLPDAGTGRSPVVTATLSLLNPFVFAGGTQVTSSSLQGHHTPFLGACSCDLDVRGVSSPGTPVHFNVAGPEGVELRGAVREVGLACRSKQVADGGRTVKLALQKRQAGGDWVDTGAWVLYAHLDPLTVKVGDIVSAGQRIGALGPPSGGEYNSSCAQGSHVHIEAHRSRCVVNQGSVIDAVPVMTIDV